MARTKLQKPKFEQGKNYEWKEEDEFVLSGIQFSKVYNTLRDMMERGGVPIVRIVDAYDTMHEVFKEAIAEGVVKEMAPKDTLLDDAIKQSEL